MFPGEEGPSMGLLRTTFGVERQFGFSMMIADEDAHACTSKMWRVPPAGHEDMWGGGHPLEGD